MAIARLEKPHCGKSAVPFMNRTTSLERTSSSMRVVASVMISSRGPGGGPDLVSNSIWCRSRQLQGVERAAHAAAERFIDLLVLADPRQAAEALGHHAGGIMVAVAGKIRDLDPRVRNPLQDQRFDLVRRHRHRNQPCDSISWRRASTILWASASRMRFSSHSTPAEVRSP